MKINPQTINEWNKSVLDAYKKELRLNSKEEKTDEECWDDIKNNYYFRGESKYVGISRPSLLRDLPDLDKNHIAVRREILAFMKNLKLLSDRNEEVADIMIDWRHKGVKTPLIDLTESLNVALFFAAIPDSAKDGCVKFFRKSKFHKSNSQQFMDLFYRNHSYMLGVTNKNIIIEGKNWNHQNVRKQKSIMCLPFQGHIGESFRVNVVHTSKKSILKEMDKVHNINVSNMFSGKEGMSVFLAIDRNKVNPLENNYEDGEYTISEGVFFDCLENYNKETYFQTSWKNEESHEDKMLRLFNNFYVFYSEQRHPARNTEEERSADFHEEKKKTRFKWILDLLEFETGTKNYQEQFWELYNFYSIMNELFSGGEKEKIKAMFNPYRVLSIDKNLYCFHLQLKQILSIRSWTKVISKEKIKLTRSLINKMEEEFKELTLFWWKFVKNLMQDVINEKTRQELRIQPQSIVNVYNNINESITKTFQGFNKESRLENSEEVERMFKVFLSHFSLILSFCSSINDYKYNQNSSSLFCDFVEKMVNNIDPDLLKKEWENIDKAGIFTTAFIEMLEASLNRRSSTTPHTSK